MFKFLILLLFTFSLNLKMDGINEYYFGHMKRLMDDIYLLNVKEGEEFYISLFSFTKEPYIFINYNETTDALDDFGLKGKMFKEIPSRVIGLSGTYNYFKFKALKPSYNKISLKFRMYHQYVWAKNFTRLFTDNIIKLNILPKD